MPKLRPNKSGNPANKGKVTNYTVSIACSVLEKSGLCVDDDLQIISNVGEITIKRSNQSMINYLIKNTRYSKEELEALTPGELLIWYREEKETNKNI